MTLIDPGKSSKVRSVSLKAASLANASTQSTVPKSRCWTIIPPILRVGPLFQISTIKLFVVLAGK